MDSGEERGESPGSVPGQVSEPSVRPRFSSDKSQHLPETADLLLLPRTVTSPEICRHSRGISTVAASDPHATLHDDSSNFIFEAENIDFDNFSETIGMICQEIRNLFSRFELLLSVSKDSVFNCLDDPTKCQKTLSLATSEKTDTKTLLQQIRDDIFVTRERSTNTVFQPPQITLDHVRKLENEEQSNVLRLNRLKNLLEDVMETCHKVLDIIPSSESDTDTTLSGVFEAFVKLERWLQVFPRFAVFIASNELIIGFSSTIAAMDRFKHQVVEFKAPVLISDIQPTWGFHEVFQHCLVEAPVFFAYRVRKLVGALKMQAEYLRRKLPERSSVDESWAERAYKVVNDSVLEIESLRKCRDTSAAALVHARRMAAGQTLHLPVRSDYEFQRRIIKRCVEEMHQTEKNFGDLMRGAKQMYFERMKHNDSPTRIFFNLQGRIMTTSWLPHRDKKLTQKQQKVLQVLSGMMGGLEEVVRTSDELAARLEGELLNWDRRQEPSCVFLALGPSVALYSRFVQLVLQERLDQRLEPRLRRIPEFEMFLQRCDPRMFGTDFHETFVQIPYSRVVRYRLLLERLEKEMSKLYSKFGEIHPDCVNVRKAYNLMSEVARTADSERQDQQMALQLQQFSKKCDLSKEELLKPERRLLFHGMAKKRNRSKDASRYFLIFSNCLMYFSMGLGSSGVTYKFHRELAFNRSSSCEISPEGDPEWFICIRTCSKSITVVLPDARSRDLWHKTVTDAIEGAAGPLARQLSDANSVSSFSQTDGRLAPIWVPDSSVTTCQFCHSTRFNLYRRRHHCRDCGIVICARCSELVLDQNTGQHDRRLCPGCDSRPKTRAKWSIIADEAAKRMSIHVDAKASFLLFQRVQLKRGPLSWKSVFVGLKHTTSGCLELLAFEAKSDTRVYRSWSLAHHSVNFPPTDQLAILIRSLEARETSTREEVLRVATAEDRNQWIEIIKSRTPIALE